MLTEIAIILTAAKFFFMPLYRSTDFEVHRNWLAVTHNLTKDKWYYDTTSEWTLDYPPFFAWLEYGLSYIAKAFDPEIVKLENLNYASDMTILFHRLSVIVLDLMYIYGVRRICHLIIPGNLLLYILLVANPGLLMVDHIHFQYNGFLFGILLVSMSNMITSNFIRAAFWFAVLLNFKHIFLYIAPVYVVYLLRAYCFTVSSYDGIHTPWNSFSIMNLIKVALTVVTVFGLSFGPFIDHLPQVLSRLFPFKRGLSHAYWAPNFWALYNFMDKVLQRLCLKFNIPVSTNEASMTGGLVQEYNHAVLPSITPTITFVITAVSMIPALMKLWLLCADRQYRCLSFVRCLTLCATCAFMFGWHVHEKAILMILIPMRFLRIFDNINETNFSDFVANLFRFLVPDISNALQQSWSRERLSFSQNPKSFLSVLGNIDARLFLFLTTVGHYSLFPLIYPKNLLSIKLFMLLTHISIAFSFIPSLYEVSRSKLSKRKRFMLLPKLKRSQSLYLFGLMIICIYENVLHSLFGLDKNLPFLPLMITSVYCALGVCYFWISLYYYFMTFTLSAVPTLSTSKTTEYEKKST